MNFHSDSKALQVFSVDDEREKELDLARLNPEEFFKNDIIRHRLTGILPDQPDYKIVNFIACVLHDITAEDINFSECDFKDTLIKRARFTNCRFDGGTFATSFFSECEFQHCTFYNLAAHSCDFHKVQFSNCDLTNLLVKSSRFADGSFQHCITSNKICEMSTLFDTTFSETPIQINTITNNFGLTSDDIKTSPIRSGRVREPYKLANIEDLKILLDSQSLSVLEKLSLEYFINQTLLNGSVLLDESLDITRWIEICKNPGSFVELLDKFAEFLVHMFEGNKISVHPILLLHDITGTLISSIKMGEKNHRVAMALGGIHLILSRIIEDYLYTLDLILQLTNESIAFLADGPTDPDYFQSLLAPWIANEDIKISRLERYNAPRNQDHSLRW